VGSSYSTGNQRAGFDDAPGDETADVPITSVSLDARELGRRSIQLLLDLISGQTALPPYQTSVIVPKIVERSSCMRVSE